MEATNDAALPKHKWRLIDAEAFIYLGKIQLVKVDDIREQNFVAISYTWSQHIKDWRELIVSLGQGHDYEERIADGSLVISIVANSENTDLSQSVIRSHLFFTAVSFLAFTRGKKLLWIDILCINQDVQQEKEYFVPKMGSLYSSADETHAYLTGSELMATVSSDQFYFPVWETRAWTLQEHVLSKKVLFCYVFNGDAIEDIKKINDSDSESQAQTVNLHSLTVDGCRVYSFQSGYCGVLGTGRQVTCYAEGESWGGGLPTSSFMNIEITERGNWNELNRCMGRSALYKTFYKLRHSGSREMVIRTSLVLLGGRESTLPEDMLYSVLGILEMENYKVRYAVGFEEARIGVFEGMEGDVLALTLGTDWGCNSNTADNDSALPRVVGSEPTLGVNSLRPSIASAKYDRKVGTTIRSRIERFRVWKDIRKSQSRSLGTVRATLGSVTSRLMIMYCVSLFDNESYSGISTSEIPEEEIHVVIVDGSRLSDEDYLSEEFEYDRVMNFMEIGQCEHQAFFADPGDEKLMHRTAVLALECVEMAPRHFRNKGTALILNASSLSGDFADNVVQ